MNGSCAGGTGAFIDQMAVLLDIDVSELNTLAGKSTNIYPIASRCGVFAKTDIQALLSRHVSVEDVAASVFHAVATQVITALSRGRDMERKILMGGGPLTFYPNLRKALANLLGIEHPDDLIIPDHPELLPAMGAAMVRNGKPCRDRVSNFLSMSGNGVSRVTNSGTKRLPTLFAGKCEFEIWQKRHAQKLVPRIDLPEAKGKALFLGVDSGSTTTKIALVDEEGKLVLGYYGANNGDPVQAVKKGLAKFREKFISVGFHPRIVRTAATGYGESLIRAAFGLNDGVVETMAHYRAARHFEPSDTPTELQEANGLFLEKLAMGSDFLKKEIRCKGCENQCRVLKLTFNNGNHFYTGNRCERCFSNNPEVQHKGKNLINDQIKLLFERDMEPEGEPILTYGIPRCLNMYENFPFWCAFLTTCGFKVVLSSESNFKLYENVHVRAV
jgi:activator of 2-hydroxyglutaryl-CoA dehydratase